MGASNIAYAQFWVGFAQRLLPAIDHEWKSIDLAMALLLDDVAADVIVHPETIDVAGRRCGFDGQGECCNGGILVDRLDLQR